MPDQNEAREMATCKMTPEQLLGLQRHARMKTQSPEISEPNVVVEIPMLVEAPPARKSTPGPWGAIFGFSLFAAVTTAEFLIGYLS